MKFVIILSPVSLYGLDADFTSAVFKKSDSFEGLMPNGMGSFFTTKIAALTAIFDI